MWPVEFQAFKEATTANFVKPFPYEEYDVKLSTENINCNSSESLNTVQVNKLKSSKKIAIYKSKLKDVDATAQVGLPAKNVSRVKNYLHTGEKLIQFTI